MAITILHSVTSKSNSRIIIFGSGPGRFVKNNILNNIKENNGKPYFLLVDINDKYGLICQEAVRNHLKTYQNGRKQKRLRSTRRQADKLIEVSDDEVD